MIVTENPKTAAELLKISSTGRYELIKGVIYELSPPGMRHGVIAWKILQKIGTFIEKNKLGIITSSETGYKLSSNPDTVRGPDGAFISNKRLEEIGIIDGYSTVMPDLAIEVNSPSDNYSRIYKKVQEWLLAGVSQVWVLEPDDRSIIIYYSNKKSLILEEEDELDGGDILPGFKCKIRDIFTI